MKINIYKSLKCISIEEGEFSVNVRNDDFDQLISEITLEHKPEELYLNDELDCWAKENGYMKEQE